ncbi:hypothetical protein, partial [Klebsiella pneumoniae]|uniref:hypothetical protein n=1 Tax=Klebsiella pneumoniae TaxID=573 RepID=UPI001CC1D5D4
MILTNHVLTRLNKVAAIKITTKVVATAKTLVVMVAKVVSVMVAIAHKVVVLPLKHHNNQHLHQLI